MIKIWQSVILCQHIADKSSDFLKILAQSERHNIEKTEESGHIKSYSKKKIENYVQLLPHMIENRRSLV